MKNVILIAVVRSSLSLPSPTGGATRSGDQTGNDQPITDRNEVDEEGRADPGDQARRSTRRRPNARDSCATLTNVQIELTLTDQIGTQRRRRRPCR